MPNGTKKNWPDCVAALSHKQGSGFPHLNDQNAAHILETPSTLNGQDIGLTF